MRKSDQKGSIREREEVEVEGKRKQKRRDGRKAPPPAFYTSQPESASRVNTRQKRVHSEFGFLDAKISGFGHRPCNCGKGRGNLR